MPPIRIELLGNLRFTFGAQLLTSVNTNRLQSLLAFLVLSADAPQSREHLAFLLWPESGESQARTNLRQLLHHLRRALPVECSLLISDSHTVLWRKDRACSVDVIEFEAAADRAQEAEKSGDPAGCREALEEAARLYQDDLLPGLHDQWLESRREHLRGKLADVLSRLVALLEAAGEYAPAIRHAARLVAQDPLRESYYQNLIRLHARNHDRSSALRVYHQCMRTLQRELGVSPSKATQDLFTQILKSDDLALAHAEAPPYAAVVPAPMVGRKLEWERLLACWRDVPPGQPHFAMILGEPGIGKTRLAEEMARVCAGHPDTVVASARCYFAQGQLAYAPVTEWLRAEPMRAARARLPRPQLAELARVLPEILVENPQIAAPQPLTESWQRRHFYEALNAAFSKAAQRALLLIEDLQWCDQDSLEWMHSLFRSEVAGQILVLGTARPEVTGHDHPSAGLMRELRQSGQVSEFSMAPLSVEETAALATQIATRECDPAFLSGLYQATRGNPLFVVESVRASLEHPGSESGGGAAPVAPSRVQAVIAARFAQLSPSAFELAGLAAAIGRPFSFDLLAKSTDWDEASLSGALEELWQRRIIEGRGAAEYDYTHDLLREVAYGGLSPVRKRFLHRRIARALEELHASQDAPQHESVSGWLAAHYEAAGMAEQAITHYRAAAAVAKQRFADAESADLIRRALLLCRDFPESSKRDAEELELLVTLGPSLVTTQGYSMPEVGETYQRALLISRRSGEQKHFFSVLSGAWLFHIVRGQLEESRRLAESCVEWASGQGIMALEMAGHFLLGTSLYHLGQLESSWQHMEQALPPYGQPSHPALALFAGSEVGVFCRSYLSHIEWQFGRTEAAAAKREEARALAREMGHPFTVATALDYAALLSVLRQEGRDALALAREAAAICRKHGFAYYLAWAEILSGWAAAAEGDVAAGLTELRHGIDALKATGAELRLPFYYGLLAEVYSWAGQTGEALASIASGFAFQSKNHEIWSAAELHRIHGDVLLKSGNAAEARASYERAIEFARLIGSRSLELRAASRLSKLPAVKKQRHNAERRSRRP